METSKVLVLYMDIIQDVVKNVKDVFYEESVDEQVLSRLKEIWEEKLKTSKTAEYEDNTIHFITEIETQNDTAPTEKETANVPNEKNHIVNEKFVPMQVNLPLNTHSNATRTLIIYVPIRILNEINLQNLLTPSIIQSTVGLPSQMAATILQQYINNALRTNKLYPATSKDTRAKNLTDGNSDSSDTEESSSSDDIIKFLDEEDEMFFEEDEHTDEPSLNSNDDVTDEESPDVLFDTDNVVVCQYYKVKRCKNKWKLCFKDGIMHLEGKDFVFQKASGDVDW